MIAKECRCYLILNIKLIVYDQVFKWELSFQLSLRCEEGWSTVWPTLWSWARTSGLEWSKLVLINFLASSKTPCNEVNICSLVILEFCLNSYDCVIYCITLLFSCLRISGQSFWFCLSGCMCLGLWSLVIWPRGLL